LAMPVENGHYNATSTRQKTPDCHDGCQEMKPLRYL
jgi:hypothetical protein